MNSLLKQTIAGVITILAVLMMYFGSYLPLKKSQLYIRAMVDLQSGKVRSLQDFINAFYPALDFYSPVGQDEIVSYYVGAVMPNLINSVVSQTGGPQVVEALLKDAEKWIDPVMKAGKGIGFSQNLYNFGSVYGLAAEKLNNDIYLQKSIYFFEEGLKSSPNRGLFFGGLFKDYQLKGDKAKIKEIGELILRYWPDNEEVRKAMESL